MQPTKKSKKGTPSVPVKEQLVTAYKRYVLTEGKQPASVYKFCLDQGIEEDDFYGYFGNFSGLEKAIWKDFIDSTINRLHADPSFQQFSSIEKVLAFYYTMLEELKGSRSFVIMQLSGHPKMEITPEYLRDFKKTYEGFIDTILKEGQKKGEIAKRPYLESRYPQLFWAHFVTLLLFWRDDESPALEKTDAYVEKSVKLAFELVGKGVLDSAIDLAKFIYQTKLK